MKSERIESWSKLSNGNHIRIMMLMPEGYCVTTVMDELYRTLYWYDTDHNREEFRYEIIGYTKKGEPEWKCIVIHSNIKMVVNEKPYYSKSEYDAAYRKDVLTP